MTFIETGMAMITLAPERPPGDVVRRNMTKMQSFSSPPQPEQVRVPHVLVVDDDDELADMQCELLRREGWSVESAHSGEQAERYLAVQVPNLVVLDLMLPGRSGLELCAMWRQRWPELAILILTAKGDPTDRIVGLEIGADDYLTKPFVARELVARVRALLRRAHRPTSNMPGIRQIGSLTLDMARHEVRLDGCNVGLTCTEFKLLLALAQQPGRPLSREQLSVAVQPGHYRPLDRTVDVQVARLRRKLQTASPRRTWIETMRGEGYLLTGN